MISSLVAEANKPPKESRIPYKAILEYFEQIPDGINIMQGSLYDENYKLTEQGARLLLHHFGYLE